MEHCLAMGAITALYLPWAAAGHAITGEWMDPRLDPEEQGAVGTFVNVVTSMALTVAMFLVVLGLHEAREIVVRKSQLGKSH